MSIKKHLNILESLYKKEAKISLDFLIDGIDVDSFFTQILVAYIVQKRVLRLSKISLMKLTQSKNLLLIHILHNKA